MATNDANTSSEFGTISSGGRMKPDLFTCVAGRKPYAYAYFTPATAFAQSLAAPETGSEKRQQQNTADIQSPSSLVEQGYLVRSASHYGVQSGP